MCHDTPHTKYNNDCNTNDGTTLCYMDYTLNNRISLSAQYLYWISCQIVKYYEAIAVSTAFYHKCLKFSVSNYLNYFNIRRHV